MVYKSHLNKPDSKKNDQILFQEDGHVDYVKLDWAGGIKADESRDSYYGGFQQCNEENKGSEKEEKKDYVIPFSKDFFKEQ